MDLPTDTDTEAVLEMDVVTAHVNAVAAIAAEVVAIVEVAVVAEII